MWETTSCQVWTVQVAVTYQLPCDAELAHAARQNRCFGLGFQDVCANVLKGFPDVRWLGITANEFLHRNSDGCLSRSVAIANRGVRSPCIDDFLFESLTASDKYTAAETRDVFRPQQPSKRWGEV